MRSKQLVGRVLLFLGVVFGVAVLASASQGNAVGPEPTVTTLTSNRAPAWVGQQITLTSKVTSVNTMTLKPSGTVTFYDGSTPLGTSDLAPSTRTAKINVWLPAGTHALTAVYNGDSTFNTSTSPQLDQVVNQGTTTTTLSYNGTSPTVVGQGFTINMRLVYSANVGQTANHQHATPSTGAADRNLNVGLSGVDGTNGNLPPSVSLNYIIRVS